MKSRQTASQQDKDARQLSVVALGSTPGETSQAEKDPDTKDLA